MPRTIPGEAAWLSLMKSERTRWHTRIERFSRPLAEVEHDPKFNLTSEDSYFCIGSCFARNVEEHLLFCGQNVLSKTIVSPANEWPTRLNGFVNKFTTHSMLNELEWLLNPPEIDEVFFENTAAGWMDLQLCAGVSPVSLERAVERRAYLMREYFSRLREASVVVLTLGLNEVWYDHKFSKYLNSAPNYYSTRREPDRYSVEITTVEDNVQTLNRIRSLLSLLNPSSKIIVTVSPVPFGETFTGKDAAVANTLSKSTLRVAAETFANEHDSVDYYPSFDMIALSPRNQAYIADCLHVADEAVGKIMRMFLQTYLGEEVSPVPFIERLYLRANPDVEADVRLGRLRSGFDHWMARGRDEGRPLAPAA